MNQLRVDKGVCRTFPATPGRLNIMFHGSNFLHIQYLQLDEERSRIRETLNLLMCANSKIDKSLYALRSVNFSISASKEGSLRLLINTVRQNTSDFRHSP